MCKLDAGTACTATYLFFGTRKLTKVDFGSGCKTNDAKASAFNNVQVSDRLGRQNAQHVRATYDTRYQVSGDLGKPKRACDQPRVIAKGSNDESYTEGDDAVLEDGVSYP